MEIGKRQIYTCADPEKNSPGGGGGIRRLYKFASGEVRGICNFLFIL